MIAYWIVVWWVATLNANLTWQQGKYLYFFLTIITDRVVLVDSANWHGSDSVDQLACWVTVDILPTLPISSVHCDSGLRPDVFDQFTWVVRQPLSLYCSLICWSCTFACSLALPLRLNSSGSICSTMFFHSFNWLGWIPSSDTSWLMPQAATPLFSLLSRVLWPLQSWRC